MNNIRNFAIVAHVDHGKSTLADRLLEYTGTIDKRHMMEQVLDSNPIERERGITIKLAPVRMKYIYKGEEYILNLIDTPGHVDFSYEVSRSMSACEGILLVVDATQNIQAQTVAHMQIIREKNLKVIPVINKVDLESAKADEVKKSMKDTFGFQENEMICVSAKTGLNIPNVVEAVIDRIPHPSGDPKSPLKILVFSSKYDTHKGVVIYVRVVEGEIRSENFQQGIRLRLNASNTVFNPIEMGVFSPVMIPKDSLSAGEVGYIATGLKDLSKAKTGDTVHIYGEQIEPLAGYKEPKPMVFLSFYPVDNDEFPLLRESMEKLHLTDSSFTFRPHSSASLGKGFLCGFLGLLHSEVVSERLEKEFDMNVIATSPTVEYIISKKDGAEIKVNTPDDYPDPSLIESIKEPVMLVTVFSPGTMVGNIMQVCEKKRAEFINLEYVGNEAKFTYLIPLSEMVFDFFDILKSVTSGYASLDYEFYEYREVDAVKLDIMVNKKSVDAFSQVVFRPNAFYIAEKTVLKLKELIPRHQFQIPIQAAIGGKIIARADIKSFRKDVTQKLYGGDRTRKDKLLEAQKKGKKKMRSLGNVEIPQEVFFKIHR